MMTVPGHVVVLLPVPLTGDSGDIVVWCLGQEWYVWCMCVVMVGPALLPSVLMVVWDGRLGIVMFSWLLPVVVEAFGKTGSHAACDDDGGRWQRTPFSEEPNKFLEKLLFILMALWKRLADPGDKSNLMMVAFYYALLLCYCVTFPCHMWPPQAVNCIVCGGGRGK